MKNDIILLDKPSGWTSFDVVAKVRGVIRKQYLDKGEKPTKRQLKVGHAGTLDPFATGLLVILLGDATKRAGEFLKLDKTYEATIRLGQVSTTGDPEGEITGVNDTVPTDQQVREVLKRFEGEITQVPPATSAIKVGGVRAYKLAHKGQVVDIPPRQVTIYSLELVEYAYPDVKVVTRVSSGTYIRSLASDIGIALGTGAYCSQLRRTRIADWDIADAVSVEEAAQTLTGVSY